MRSLSVEIPAVRSEPRPGWLIGLAIWVCLFSAGFLVTRAYIVHSQPASHARAGR